MTSTVCRDCPAGQRCAQGRAEKSHDQLMPGPQTGAIRQIVDPIRMQLAGTFQSAAKVSSASFHNRPAARGTPNPNSDFHGRFGIAVYVRETRPSPPRFVSPLEACFVAQTLDSAEKTYFVSLRRDCLKTPRNRADCFDFSFTQGRLCCAEHRFTFWSKAP